MIKILRREYEELREDFEYLTVDYGSECVCSHNGAPCPLCEHEGNPLNLEGNDAAWATPAEALEELRQRVYDQIDAAEFEARMALRDDTFKALGYLAGVMAGQRVEHRVVFGTSPVIPKGLMDDWYAALAGY